ncbi:MAG TPA: hypothetical protein ENJ32_12445 [Crenotrichaceae bacterium]|nr:hypothetical protein [Crenotrichaceae bacterium]
MLALKQRFVIDEVISNQYPCVFSSRQSIARILASQSRQIDTRRITAVLFSIDNTILLDNAKQNR